MSTAPSSPQGTPPDTLSTTDNHRIPFAIAKTRSRLAIHQAGCVWVYRFQAGKRETDAQCKVTVTPPAWARLGRMADLSSDEVSMPLLLAVQEAMQGVCNG